MRFRLYRIPGRKHIFLPPFSELASSTHSCSPFSFFILFCWLFIRHIYLLFAHLLARWTAPETAAQWQGRSSDCIRHHPAGIMGGPIWGGNVRPPVGNGKLLTECGSLKVRWARDPGYPLAQLLAARRHHA